MNTDKYFLENYQESKQRFLKSFDDIKNIWPKCEYHEYPISKDDKSISIDTITAYPNEYNKNLIIITTGEHGIEAYVGVAMLHRFIDTYLSQLDSNNTGILLVHGLNPWGMKYKRRVNENNIDLNRNFIWNWNRFDKKINVFYKKLHKFFAPEGEIKNKTLNDAVFYKNLIQSILKSGISNFKAAPILGQYETPNGIYYGGNGYELSTEYMIDLYNHHVKNFEKIIHIDIHTGYGPRNQMSIVNSSLETRKSQDLVEKFSYPLVQKANLDEFYAIQGDMIDYFYRYMKENHKDKNYYGTCFEFGTFGDSLGASIKSLKTMIDENRLYFNSTKDEKAKEKIEDDFLEMFYPKDKEWREKATKDFVHAIEGILRYETII
ncbi:M14 family metallopeptidase [Sporosalibacterium faouarense]|uniref:M14 family metallopeptidase n=1 Tax=Sporosalibacterium faouarense TaxID=516123 RepID=UPI00192B6861|nr:M14 family metallopeptidase [Sporosalibacterium faouarense]